MELSFANGGSTRAARSPVVAGILSSVLPGAGQVYNNQIAKAVIYDAILAASVYFTVNVWQAYNTFLSQYRRALAGEPTRLPPQVLESYVIYYRRLVEVGIATIAITYLMQVTDAVVYAHLSTFDVSPVLTMGVRIPVGL